MQLMEQLRDSFDVVLVDSPPAGVIVDAVEIAKYCDGALIVVSYNRGKKQEVSEVKEAIEKTGCKVLGAVLNNVDFDLYSNRKYYYKSERYAYYYNSVTSYSEAISFNRFTSAFWTPPICILLFTIRIRFFGMSVTHSSPITLFLESKQLERFRILPFRKKLKCLCHPGGP